MEVQILKEGPGKKLDSQSKNIYANQKICSNFEEIKSNILYSTRPETSTQNPRLKEPFQVGVIFTRIRTYFVGLRKYFQIVNTFFPSPLKWVFFLNLNFSRPLKSF